MFQAPTFLAASYEQGFEVWNSTFGEYAKFFPALSGDALCRPEKMFVAEATARASAEIVGVNKQTAATFFTRLRLLIASKLPSYELSG